MKNWLCSIAATADESSHHRPAIDDLERIHAYISKNNPAAASRVITRLIDRAMALPMRRIRAVRLTSRTRVVVVPRFRYFIFYTIENDEIHVTHFRHTSRRRPWNVE